MSKSDRQGQIPYHFTHIWNSKQINKQTNKTEQKHRDPENTLVVTREKRWDGGSVKWKKGVNSELMDGN